MEQMLTFVADNSGWIAMGMGLIGLLLLTATLHRTKQLSKNMKKMTEGLDRLSMYAAAPAAQQGKNNAQQEKGAGGQEQDAARLIKSEETSQKCPEQRAAAAEEPEQLLNAVLGEVFS